MKPSWVRRRSWSSWPSWFVQTDARVRTEEAEDGQVDARGRTRSSERTHARGRAGPGREWGRNSSRVCLSLSLLNPLSLTIPLYSRAISSMRARRKRRKAGEVPRGSDFPPWVPSLFRARLLRSMATASGRLATPQTPNAKGGCLRRRGRRHTAPSQVTPDA